MNNIFAVSETNHDEDFNGPCWIDTSYSNVDTRTVVPEEMEIFPCYIPSNYINGSFDESPFYVSPISSANLTSNENSVVRSDGIKEFDDIHKPDEHINSKQFITQNSLHSFDSCNENTLEKEDANYSFSEKSHSLPSLEETRDTVIDLDSDEDTKMVIDINGTETNEDDTVEDKQKNNRNGTQIDSVSDNKQMNNIANTSIEEKRTNDSQINTEAEKNISNDQATKNKIDEQESILKACQRFAENENKCELCKQCFGDSYKLIKHKCPFEDNKVYKCDICRKKFNRPDRLNRHKNYHPVFYRCEICYKKFETSHYLLYHQIKKRHCFDRTRCNVCDSYAIKGYIRHKYKLHENETIPTSLIPASVLKNNDVNKNLTNLSAVGVETSVDSLLEPHKQSHTDELLYETKSEFSIDFNAHKQFHTSDKLNKCEPILGSYMKDADFYKSHVPKNIEQASKTDWYFCRNCLKCFNSYICLSNHMCQQNKPFHENETTPTSVLKNNDVNKNVTNLTTENQTRNICNTEESSNRKQSNLIQCEKCKQHFDSQESLANHERHSNCFQRSQCNITITKRQKCTEYLLENGNQLWHCNKTHQKPILKEATSLLSPSKRQRKESTKPEVVINPIIIVNYMPVKCLVIPRQPENKPFQCNVCLERFETALILSAHKCATNKNNVGDEISVEEPHKQCHTIKQPYEVRSEFFADLNAHNHTDDKPKKNEPILDSNKEAFVYKSNNCNKCGQNVCEQLKLNKHNQTHIPENIEHVPPKTNWYYCRVCMKCFNSSVCFSNHKCQQNKGKLSFDPKRKQYYIGDQLYITKVWSEFSDSTDVSNN